MHKVTLISTEHRETGECNSDELLKIIKTIKPDIIFEEEPNDKHYLSYYNNENTFNSLEVKTIKKYKVNHEIIHIPIDKQINELVSIHYQDVLNKEFKQNNNYKLLIKEHCTLRDNHGFAYLNSTRCMNLFEKIKREEEQIIANSEFEEKLIKYYNLFHQELDFREMTMLQNICSFSKLNNFERAIFFLGFAHRKSIKEKILNNKFNEDLKIDWTFYDGKNLAKT